MQTFLPYPDFTRSARALDWRRLGKQRVEALQLLKVLRGETRGWRNHPAALMWAGYESALELYMGVCIAEWIRRGYRNTMSWKLHERVIMPPWFGNPAFHIAHQSNLIRKDPAFYGPLFPGVPANLPYVWPVDRSHLAA